MGPPGPEGPRHRDSLVPRGRQTVQSGPWQALGSLTPACFVASSRQQGVVSLCHSPGSDPASTLRQHLALIGDPPSRAQQDPRVLSLSSLSSCRCYFKIGPCPAWQARAGAGRASSAAAYKHNAQLHITYMYSYNFTGQGKRECSCSAHTGSRS